MRLSKYLIAIGLGIKNRDTKKRYVFVFSAGLAVLLSTSFAHAAGDVRKGEAVFMDTCADCHSLQEGKNRKGPSLFGVVGRKAGSVAGYSYSEAVRKSEIVWTPEQISAYLTLSKKLIPGTKMRVEPSDLTSAERADVIAYLASAHR